ncbi:endothelin-converting enzyme Metallo peptidase. MEROPS family M13 [Flavobacterium gillisiae]|uniref:Endothelin-converting enzyme Metallo peptidase. MEROPS family M13 n=1 Tax=Flavobacterium gillisiae TaxID=150146 RepID=A0A1H3YLN3_9FLAO|nr:M13 family metallopeptidase [Flavobacterium gillisiae]SEA12423.1 endothelin-converting enzyme Metallo peptidase. MEROPS family M13 [Flavobacterium gillisiae]
MKIKLSSFKIALLVLSILILGACNKIKSDEKLASGLMLKNMDTLIRPGDNFDAYVNGTWQRNTAIPADKPSYGAGYMVYDKSQEDVKAIIETAAKSDFAAGSDEQKIGNFYGSFMDSVARNKIGIAPLLPEFKKIDSISNYSDLAKYFGRANQSANNSPFSIGVMEDLKDPTTYMLYGWQGGLGLPDREYYFLEDPKSKEIRKKYMTHIENMLQLGGIENSAALATKIMTLETSLASKHMKKEQTRDMMKLYNKYAIKDLKQLMPDFDWASLLTSAGIKNQKNIVIPQVEYIKALNDIIKTTPLATWKAYFKWSVVHGAATSLNTALSNENFNFYGKTLSGTEKQRPLWRRGVETVNKNLGEIVGKVYVEKHFSPEAKEKVSLLVKNLVKAYEESIKKLDWMSPETKKQALDKVSKFTVKIGYPDKWRDYSSLKISKNDYFGNQQRATAFEYNRQLNKLGKTVDRTEWGMTPQTVNAYYNPPLNEIVFPAAILQPPFYDPNVEDAVNYGGIGAVIGHEIGHGFDDQGSTFDGDGVMRNWWTPKDLAAFKQKTGALVAQYSALKVFPDLNVNGEFTQGENIGDLGGLSIALKAYKMSLNGKESPVLDGFTGEQRIFLSWGQVWLDKAREDDLRAQVANDPHSPAKFRINGVVRNIPEFYTAFNIKPTDSLYLAPNKRVKIW